MFEVHPGVYTGQVSCSGQDYASFIGDGPSTQIVAAGITGENGVLELGTSTNVTIAGFRIKGHRAIIAEWGGASGGKFTVYDMDLESEGVASDEDCIWVDNPGSGTDIFLRDIRCHTNADGFTINSGGAGVTFNSIGNRFSRMSGSGNNGYFYAFEGIPCEINISADVVTSTGDYNATSTRYVNFDGTQTGCSASAIANVSGVTGQITNTEASGAGSIKFVDVNSTATELGFVNLVSNSFSLTNSSSSGSATGVDLQNATTQMNVYGGRYRSTGTGAVDFKVAGGAAGATFKLWGVDYTNTTAPGAEITEGDPKKITASQQALFTSSATITYSTDVDASTGLLLDNTEASSDEASPMLQLSNGGASDEEWDFRVIGSGRLDIRNPSGTTVMDWRTGGNALDIFAGLNLTNKNAAPVLKLGDGTNVDTMAITWDSGTTDASITWNDTSDRIEFGNVAQMRLAGSASAPATCSIGDVYIDTTAGSVAWCLCTAANTWTAVGGTGTCS